MSTKIEWAEEVWNPVTGCTKVSQGCKHCYAERMAKRLAGRFGYPEAPDQFKVMLHPYLLDKPLSWKKPRRVFINSMSDLFHEDVPESFIARIFAVIAIAKFHNFLILTKRPKRMLKILDDWSFDKHIESWQEQICGEKGFCPQDFDYPLPNVWLGVSVEDQQTTNERIPYLLQTPAAVRFVSCEPLLGPVNFGAWLGNRRNNELGVAPFIDWVIVGGESGPGARIMEITWLDYLITQAKVANIPIFVKQLGGYPDKRNRIEEWPEDLRIRECPHD